MSEERYPWLEDGVTNEEWRAVGAENLRKLIDRVVTVTGDKDALIQVGSEEDIPTHTITITETDWLDDDLTLLVNRREPVQDAWKLSRDNPGVWVRENHEST